MYEEKRFYNKRVNWLSVFLKLLLLILVAFLVWFVIYKHRNKTTKPKDAKPMSENLSTLKADYVKYFNEDNIPKSINDEVKVPLEALYDETKINTIYDKNGKECSPASSYGQMTKLDSNVYKLKVYLKCKNEADSIITTLTKEEIIAAKFEEKDTKKDTKKTDTKKTDSKKNDTKKDDSKKTTDTKNTKDTNKTSTDNKKVTDTNKTTTKTTDNNKATTNTNKTTTDTNKTTTNTNKNNTNTNTNTNKTNTNSTSTSTSSSSSSSVATTTTTTTQQPTTATTTTTTTTKPTVEEIISDPSRIVSTEYRMIKYGEKTYTKPYGKYVSRTETIKYYKYCINNDMYNCHKNIAKIPENEQIIYTLLQLGYKEYEDKTNTVIVYIPILDEIWSDSQNLAGYTYTGESRTHYRMD